MLMMVLYRAAQVVTVINLRKCLLNEAQGLRYTVLTTARLVLVDAIGCELVAGQHAKQSDLAGSDRGKATTAATLTGGADPV